MLRAPCPGGAARDRALPLSGWQNKSLGAEFFDSRRDRVDRFLKRGGDLAVRMGSGALQVLENQRLT
jgi:hypothetical protein